MRVGRRAAPDQQDSRGHQSEASIPPRTLPHRLAKGERLTVDESDRALRLARIIAMAEITFGDHAKALAWSRCRLASLCP